MDHADKVEALAILNSPHDRGEEAQNMVEARARKVREQGAMATLDDALKRWFTPDYLASGDGVGKVRRWRERVDPESYAQAAWVLANGVRELIRPPVAIHAPALVMTCENDTGSTMKMCHDIASELEGSVTIIVPELQHLGLLEQPQTFTSPILNFLERTLK
jgi:pimeloyl-ACP methyl ester carboxylesterase